MDKKDAHGISDEELIIAVMPRRVPILEQCVCCEGWMYESMARCGFCGKMQTK